ncbi:MAG: hypothetical protein V2A58_15720 [Planctomycetota bacterium]
MLANRSRYEESVRKGIGWIVSQTNGDGTVNPAEKGAFAYYKLPWALALAGRAREAASIIRWIVAETMTATGDFHTDKRSKFHLDYYAYENAWIVAAAHTLGLFDISRRGWAYIETLRDPHTGGFCSNRPFEEGANLQEDPLSTAWASNVALHLGHLDAAASAAGFLRMIWDIQPDPRDAFYFRWRPGTGLIVARLPEEPADRDFRVSATEPQNWYYILGAQIAFLAKLYLASGDRAHLELALRVNDFAMRCHEDVFHTDSSGKIGYGNSFLYYATGEERFLRAAERCADYLADDQRPEGFWMRDGKPTASSTAEFCLWLGTLVSVDAALSRGNGAGHVRA